ncbi:MAG: DUF4235 domain-containing protein [Gemmatimonadaceae bacterium]
MTAAPQKVLWFAVGASSAMAAGIVVKRSLDAGWRAATSKDPPDDPESLKTGWKDALLWTAISAVAVGVAQLTARRGAALGWRQVTGRRPPH